MQAQLMATLGLLGGMSWESTVPYYRIINQTVRERLGGHHSAPLLLNSLDFAVIEALQARNDWQGAARTLVDASRALERAGAQALVLCTNTMHRVADVLEAEVDLPLLHIADATAAAVRAGGLQRVALLGTRFTMEQPFYRERLAGGAGVQVLVPGPDDRDRVHRIIYQELCHGELHDSSRREFQGVMARLVEAGAQGVILGCTEIGLLVGTEDAPVPLFDTAALHARHAALWALERNREELCT